MNGKNEKNRTKLKQFRSSRLLSQEQISKQLGYTRAHYARFENGAAEITLRFLEALTKAFNITFDEAKDLTKRDNE